MHWIDVSGPPGSGKSTNCDHFWGPHAVQVLDQLPPASWQAFVNETTELFRLISPHPTIEAAIRMNNRSFRKIGTIARMQGSFPYVQTGLLQRIFGFGWRLVDLGVDVTVLRGALETMPVSLGVVVTKCDPEVVKQRNRDREKVAATAHENRQHMVDLMQPAIDFGLEVLHARGVPILKVSTEQPISEARRKLIDFAISQLNHAQADGYCREMAMVQKPAWWR